MTINYLVTFYDVHNYKKCHLISRFFHIILWGKNNDSVHERMFHINWPMNKQIVIFIDIWPVTSRNKTVGFGMYVHDYFCDNTVAK